MASLNNPIIEEKLEHVSLQRGSMLLQDSWLGMKCILLMRLTVSINNHVYNQNLIVLLVVTVQEINSKIVDINNPIIGEMSEHMYL